MSKEKRRPSDPNPPRPDRRQVLQVGAATGALAISGTGCAMLGALPLPLSAGGEAPRVLNQAELKAYGVQLDQALATLSRVKGFTQHIPNARPQDPQWRRAAAEVEVLGRQTLRSLTFAGMIGSLAPENQRDASIRARVETMQPELDETVFSMTSVLANTSKEQRRQVQNAFRSNPRGRQMLVAFFDAPAKELGLPREKRKQMLRIIDQISWRMRKQAPDALFDEYVARVEKVARRSGQVEEFRRHLATSAANNLLWGSVERGGAKDDAAEVPPKYGRARPPSLEREKAQHQRPILTRKGREITSGGILFGIGLASVGAVLGTWIGGGAGIGLGLITPASVITLVGLVTLFVGLARSGEMWVKPKRRQ